MDLVDDDNVHRARALIEQGWRPAAELATIKAPYNIPVNGRRLVSDWTWAVMHLQELARRGPSGECA